MGTPEEAIHVKDEIIQRGRQILQGALSLNDKDRAEIAARLLESLDDSGDEQSTDVEEAWAAEIERRCATLEAGKTGTTDWEEVGRKIEAEILRQ